MKQHLRRMLLIPLLLCGVMIASNIANGQLANNPCSPSFSYGAMNVTSVSINNVANNTFYNTGAYTGTGTNTGLTYNVLGSNASNTTVPFVLTGAGGFGTWDQNYYDMAYFVYVDFANNGTFTQVASTSYAYPSYSSSFIIPAGTSYGPKRLRIIAVYSYYSFPGSACPGTLSNYGEFKDVTLNFQPPVPDVGITSISATTPPPFPAGNNTITAVVRSYGSAAINSCVVNWTLDGVAQTPVNATFSPALTTNQTSTVTLGVASFPSIGSRVIVASTTSPNSAIDGNTANDAGPATTLAAALPAGTYTIGGTAPSFATFPPALTQLNLGGQLGAITMLVRPGTYTGNVTIANVPGNKGVASNTITIIPDASQGGARGNVILSHDGGSSTALVGNGFSGEPTVRLQNVDNVTLRNLSITASGAGAALNARALDIIGNTGVTTDGCVNLTVDACDFTGSATNTSFSTQNMIVTAMTSNHTNLRLTRNTFTDGGGAIYQDRTVTPFTTGVVISGNTFTNFASLAIRTNITDGMVNDSNTITSTRATTAGTAIGAVNSNNVGLYRFTRNRILLNGVISTSGTGYQNGGRSAGGIRGLVANNFIQVNATSAASGILNGTSAGEIDYFHNTVNVNSLGAAASLNSGSGLNVTNNIFINQNATGRAIDNGSGVITSSNYNRYVSAGAVMGLNLGVSQATIAAWRTATGRDAQSTSSASLALASVSTNDLSITSVDTTLYGFGSTSSNGSIGSGGTFASGIRTQVPVDIFNNSRSRTEVYMGAHQIIPVISMTSQSPVASEGCQNSDFSLFVNTTASFGAAMSYQWQRNGAPLIDGVNGVSGSRTPILNVVSSQKSLHEGAYVCRISATGGATNLNSQTINVVVNAPIDIVRHPESRIICNNNETSLSVIANGTVYTYQWQKDGVNIPGATSPVLPVTNASSRTSGSYRCVMTGTCGTPLVNTNSAAIYVADNTLIAGQPEFKGVAIGGTARLSVEVNASNQIPNYSPQFQWYRGTTMLVDDGRISGATSNLLTIRNVRASDIDTNYRVVATGLCGTQTSSNTGFYVSSLAVTTQPENKKVCVGASTNVMVAVNSNIPNAQYSYQWYKDGVALANGGIYSGVTAASMTVTNADASVAGQYTCTVSAMPSGANITSDAATITVNTTPTVSTQPQDVTICEGATATMNAAATGSDLRYSWMLNGTVVAGATDASVSVPNVPAAANGAKVKCMVTNDCGMVETQEATLTVNTKPAITTQPQSGSAVFQGTLSLSVAATGSGTLSYQWKKNAVAIPGATSATYTETPAIDVAGSYTVDITNSCGTVTSSAAVITVSSVGNEEALSAGFAISDVDPTPTSETGTVRITSPSTTQVRVIITDIYGRQLAQIYNGLLQSGSTMLTVPTLGLANGMYFVTMQSDKYTLSQKMVIIK